MNNKNSRKERLSLRTCKLIEDYKGIFLRRKNRSLYLCQWTCIQAGPDAANWTYLPHCAMEIFNLEWAFALAKLYDCVVVSRRIRPKKMVRIDEQREAGKAI